MPDQPDKIAEKLGVNAPNSQVNIENMFVGSTPDPTAQKEKLVDWQKICRDMLVERQQLTSNRLMVSPDMHKDLDVFVDLALVQQRKADKRDEDILPEYGSQLYEPSRYSESERFEFNRFLTDVLGEQKNEKLTIVGEPGCGKTTLLQKIAFWLLDNTEDLVIWVSLGELKEKSLRDYLTEDWLQEAVMYSDSTILENWQGQFLRRRVWLLLDGLDEMTLETRDALSLRGWVSQARVILTCRLNVWQTNPRIIHGFETYRMLEFRLPQIEEFIQKWFLDDKALGNRLYRALEQSGKERIKDLVRNPLRLTLLCSTWHLRDGKLPDTRAELYEQFVNDLYDWKRDQFPTTEADRKNLNQKLGELATKAIDTELTRFRLRHDLVCSVLGHPGAVGSMLDLALSLGWLNAVGIDPDNPRKPVYAFFHATFQEYFAAKKIESWNFFLPSSHDEVKLNSENRKIEEPYRLFEPQWKEVILLWLGRTEIESGIKNNFIDSLLNFEDGCRGFYEYKALFLGVLGAQEYSDYLGIKSAIEKVKEWAFGTLDDDSGEWFSYVEPLESEARLTLLNTSGHIIVDVLRELLNTVNDHYKLYEVANLLIKVDFNSKAATDTLLGLLKSAEKDWQKLEIATSLIETSSDISETKASLVWLSRHGEYEWIKRDAALSLLKVEPNHPDGIDGLINLLCTSQEETLLWSLQLNEIKSHHPKVIRALTKMSYQGKSQNTREISISFLSSILISDESAIEKILRIIRLPGYLLGLIKRSDAAPIDNFDFFNYLVDTINNLLISDDKRSRRKAFWRLIEFVLEYPEVALATARLGSNQQGGELRKNLVLDLFKLTGHDINLVVPVWVDLIEKLEARRPRVFLATKMADAGFEDDRITSVLLKLLEETDNHDENARRWLAGGLRKYDPRNIDAIETFLDLLQTSESWNTCRWVAKELGEACNENPMLVESLIDQLLSTDKQRIIAAVARGIKEIFDLDELKIVLGRLKNSLSKDIRENNAFLYESIFEIIWHCASRLPYLDFHEIWNRPPTDSTTCQSSKG